MLRKEYGKECTNCKVLPQEAVTTQHRVLVAELEVKATRQRRAEGRKQIRWWKLKDEKVKENFMIGVVDILSNGIEVMTTNVDECWEETARQIRTCGEEICGRSSGKKKPGIESWLWNEETEKAVNEKKDRLKTWKRTSAESDRKEYNLVKATANKVVARVKAEAIDGLYDNMETIEGQKDVYRIAAARDREDEYIRERWGQYFSWLMNEENPRVETEDWAPNQGMTSPVIEAEIERALRGMKCGKAVGTECIPSAWRNSILVPFSKKRVTFKSVRITEASNCSHTPSKYGRRWSTEG